MAATLDRAGVEYDLAGDNGGERVPYTTDAEDGSAANGQSSKKDRLTRKVKKIMHINKPVAAIPEPSVGVTLAPSPDSPSTTAQLGEDVREKGLSGLEDFVHQPVQTVRATMQRRTNREAAETFVTAEIPHAKNVELIQAQDRRTEAKTREEQITAEHDVETLKKARQDSFVRWTIDRHVKKIRRLERDRIPRRARADFVRKDRGGAKKTDWNAYCTHVRLMSLVISHCNALLIDVWSLVASALLCREIRRPVHRLVRRTDSCNTRHDKCECREADTCLVILTSNDHAHATHIPVGQ